jgi:hypothetical protein
MAKPIPAREPIGDTFNGAVVQIGILQALAPTPLEGAETVISGTLTVRYGVRYLGKPHLSIVPGLVAIDYGDMLVGDEAWEFITRHSNQYPRAEVFGYRNDGKDEMMYIKNLDLVQPVEVLVYASEAATTPAARPTALIAPADVDLPPRMRQHLPRYNSLADWQDSI